MNDILIAVLIGVVAGIIDVIPMILMKLDKVANLSAFTHYFVLGIIIPFVDWGLEPWMTGVIISFLSAIPVMIMSYPHDKKSLIPISVFSVILGAAIGFAGAKFIG